MDEIGNGSQSDEADEKTTENVHVVIQALQTLTEKMKNILEEHVEVCHEEQDTTSTLQGAARFLPAQDEKNTPKLCRSPRKPNLRGLVSDYQIHYRKI